MGATRDYSHPQVHVVLQFLLQISGAKLELKHNEKNTRSNKLLLLHVFLISLNLNNTAENISTPRSRTVSCISGTCRRPTAEGSAEWQEAATCGLWLCGFLLSYNRLVKAKHTSCCMCGSLRSVYCSLFVTVQSRESIRSPHFSFQEPINGDKPISEQSNAF